MSNVSQLPRTCVVLGAGGFIGGHLCMRLHQQGNVVIGADIKTHEYLSLPCKFVLCDLREYKHVLDVIPEDVDEVYQLAADMGGATYINAGLYDADVMSNSMQINLNVLRAAVAKRTKKLFYSSSACVYPEYNQLDPQNPKCTEDSVYPAEPDTEYGWEKLFSERLYAAYAKQHGLNIRIARFHNIYGPYGTYSGGKEKAPAALCRKVAHAHPASNIEIIGDGQQTRSFLYIDDCINAVQRLMESDYKQPLNIGSEEMVTINYLASIIMGIAKKDLGLSHVQGPQGVRGRNSDNGLIRKILHWEPQISLLDGITRTYSWISSLTGMDSGRHMPRDTLVVVLCETRAHRLTGDLFMKNVVKELNADLALCVGVNANTEKPNAFYDNAKYVWETQEPQNIAELYDSISQMESSTQNWREVLSLRNMLMGNIKPHVGSGAYLYYYRWALLQKIKELALDKKYKWFVITRSDFMWNVPHPSMSLLNQDILYLPDGENYGGVTDRHLIVSYKHVCKAIDLMEPIIHRPTWLVANLLSAPEHNPECFIKLWFTINGLKIAFFPYVMYSVREKNGSTSWSVGDYDESLGYYIKYTTEYASYLRYKDFTAASWLDYFTKTI